MKSVLREFEARGNPEQSGELLTILVAMMRPKRSDDMAAAESSLRQLIDLLKEDSSYSDNLRWHIRNIILQGDIEHVLSDSGVAEGGSFFSEFSSRIRHVFLPELRRENDLGDFIRRIFYRPNDYYWLIGISDELWVELFELLGIRLHTAEKNDIIKIFDAASALSYRICGNILDKQFQDYPQYRKSDSPFLKQNRNFSNFKALFDKGEPLTGKGHKLFEELERCRLAVEKIKRDRNEKGAGLQQTFLLVKLERQIARLKIITAVLDDDLPVDIPRTVLFFKRIVYFEARKDRLGALVSDNVGLLAFQISEHKSQTGEHYITTTKKEYFEFFRSAAGGGIFAAFMGLIKLIIHHLHFALFWQHFWYSINYAVGFVGIHVSGSTLATKQPSMTAAALAGSLDVNKNGLVSPAEIAITFGKVWRSQFVAFAGNLLVTFPMAFLLAIAYDFVMGEPIAGGEAATDLLIAQNPLETPVYIYASVTGIMLFVSGLISGYYDNMILFGRIPERVEFHPVLRKFFPASFLARVGIYLRNNLGSLAGNISLGFLLGFPAFFGNIFGMAFDIRHITISTAHYAIGIYGNLFEPDWYNIIACLFGITIIGFFNFFVSFSLAFWVAIKSRNIRFGGYLRIPAYIWKYFRKYPKDFIYPPKSARLPSDLGFE